MNSRHFTGMTGGILLLFALTGTPGHAATVNWTNTAGGSYDTAGNWSAAPLSTDDVVFNLNDTYTVNFPTGSDQTNRSALVDGGDVTFDIGGVARNYTLTGPITGQDLMVGNNNTATLTLTNGRLTTPFTYIGTVAGSNGTLNVSAGATLWGDDAQIMNAIRVGTVGTGTMHVINGGVVRTDYVYIGGSSGSSGAVTVDGAGSRLVYDEGVRVRGTGSLLAISNGGLVDGDWALGYSSVANGGTVTVDGAGSQFTGAQ